MAAKTPRQIIIVSWSSFTSPQMTFYSVPGANACTCGSPHAPIDAMHERTLGQTACPPSAPRWRRARLQRHRRAVADHYLDQAGDGAASRTWLDPGHLDRTRTLAEVTPHDQPQSHRPHGQRGTRCRICRARDAIASRNRPLMGRRLEHQVHEGQQGYFLSQGAFARSAGCFKYSSLFLPDNH